MLNDVSFHLSHEDGHRLRNAAEALGVTVSDLMRDGVLSHLRSLEQRHHGGQPFPLPRWRRRKTVA
jgi:hypothetical protein